VHFIHSLKRTYPLNGKQLQANLPAILL